MDLRVDFSDFDLDENWWQLRVPIFFCSFYSEGEVKSKHPSLKWRWKTTQKQLVLGLCIFLHFEGYLRCWNNLQESFCEEDLGKPLIIKKNSDRIWRSSVEIIGVKRSEDGISGKVTIRDYRLLYFTEILHEKPCEETGLYLFKVLISPNPNRKNLPQTSRRVLEIREKLFDLFMLSLSGKK